VDPHAGTTVVALSGRDGKQTNTSLEKEEMLRHKSFLLKDGDQQYEPPPAGSVLTCATEQAVKRALFSQSMKKELGSEKLSFGAILLHWRWDKERIARVKRAEVCTRRHPALWKQGSGVVIQVPGKVDYSMRKVYSSVSLLSCMGTVVEKAATELLSEEAETTGLRSYGQFGCRKGPSAIDAAAIMFDRSHAV
jgi:hypothetical protein